MSTPDYHASELEALASDPQTDWDVLHWIAENYPELRPAVAANPGTYQELIEALGSLGDPAIDEAIALRGTSGVYSSTAATNPLAGMYDTATHDFAPLSDEYYGGYDDEAQDYEAQEPQDYEAYRAARSAHERETESAVPSSTQEPETHQYPEDHEADAQTHEDPASEAESLPVPHAGEFRMDSRSAEASGGDEDGPAAASAETPAPAAPVPDAAAQEHHVPVPEDRDTVPAEGGTAQDDVPAADTEAEPSGREAEEDSEDDDVVAPLERDTAAAAAAAPVPVAAPALEVAQGHPAADPEPVSQAPGAEAPAPEPVAAREHRPAPILAGAGVPPEPEQDGGAGARRWLPIAAVVVFALAAIGVVALVLNLLGGEEDPVAEPGPTPTQAPAPSPAAEETDEPQTSEEEPSEEDAEALVTAQAALAALPEESSCEAPLEDGSTVAEYLGLAQGEELDEDLLEDTFTELQSSCSATHAAAVFTEARTSEAGGQLMQTVGTDWVNQQMSTSGAQTMSGFVTPDGNAACEFADGLRCTVFEQTSAAPAGCGSGATFHMPVDASASLDCDNHPIDDSDFDTLGYNQSATDGFAACVSLDDRISCFNALNAQGFEMSERDHYTVSY
ncbi:variant leucine-rich repeat-containing protein [Nesterenkonia flava]|uniref:Leucine rich repeat variant domain-containing protein n=1 Tax=Nesterenkonia flava TaxID=469799 RepID=A0ABU1FQ47_9MICC|nr:hypothetical protein [Nesterenkonia flava]MDR5710759.1 hypothetical protein [Nesterenkonia flava]